MYSFTTFPKQFLPRYCQTNPNTVKMYNLFTTDNTNILDRLCKYIIFVQILMYSILVKQVMRINNLT